LPTHGSLTKAGKVRKLINHMPIWREVQKKTSSGLVIRKYNHKRRPIPRVRNKRNYKRRILYGDKDTRYTW